MKEKSGRPSNEIDRKKFKTISIDDDLVELIQSTSTKLMEEFGFRPTLSQTLQYLIKKGEK